ncbi:MAG: hypothetical protein JSS32_09790 [Verrucomicrobia bacterium]|nr:hypothetical protein [Verrucomicrobiota bacterium]
MSAVSSAVQRYHFPTIHPGPVKITRDFTSRVTQLVSNVFPEVLAGKKSHMCTGVTSENIGNSLRIKNFNLVDQEGEKYVTSIYVNAPRI